MQLINLTTTIGMFKRDSFIFGLITGLFAAAISTAIIYIALKLTKSYDLFAQGKIFMLGIIINLILIRYYIKNLKFMETGKGLITISLICVLLFYYYQYHK